MTDIADARFLIIATDGFEQSELFEPRDQLIAAGAKVDLASPDRQPIQGMKHDEKGATITPDLTLEEVDGANYDALIIPGGVANPDALRMDDDAVDIVRDFFDAGKPVAAICHGPWLLVEADVVEDRRVTSWPSVRTDLENAGAIVVDEEVVVDGNLITSRKPGDIPAFVAAIRAAVAEAAPVAAA
ncbi:type 1 glutamine amidotransferase domain-containing protein [Sphingobium phenoxybenzoativorans]|uniref:type 1 glutamine amidotransferase domain-containing protein n=1 Tax=Sphingobium phenoxybenzoativorans TaxID=1592790 RepID=UPI0008727F01|nr:type 1 glutamine amidotransferase domain-containing protein [Sphingobium phenoxybenzoativorans]